MKIKDIALPTDNSVCWYEYRTRNNNIYPLEVGMAVCRIGDLTYDPDTVRGLCKTGCKNYGIAGGCPPRAPKLLDIVEEKHPVWLVYCRFWSVFKPPKVAASKNTALHWKFQDGIVSRFLVKVGHDLVDKIEGSFLSTGYCMGCPGRKCNFKLGYGYCRNPAKRTFSMEATGINVVDTVKKVFGLQMHWYYRGNTDDPNLLKCIAVLPATERFTGKELDLLLEVLR